MSPSTFRVTVKVGLLGQLAVSPSFPGLGTYVTDTGIAVKLNFKSHAPSGKKKSENTGKTVELEVTVMSGLWGVSPT